MRTFFVYTILVFCFFCVVEEVQACVCKPQKLDYKIKNADLVFVGEVTKITKNSEGEEITFNISESLKSHFLNIENPIKETTVFQGTRFSCVFGFEVGKKYIVFSNNFSNKDFSNSRFSTFLCSGNEVFSK